MDALASPNLKRARAYEHLQAFNEKLTTFQKANPYTTYQAFDPLDGFPMLKLKLVGRPKPDPRWGTIVGDFASNLRAALDHLVWAMSMNPAKPHRVEFPIEETPALFNNKKKLAISAIPQQAQAAIEGLQPYKKWGSIGESPLWRIKCLANADKHRTVSVIATGLFYRLGSVLPGPTQMFMEFPENPQLDITMPKLGQAHTYLQTGNQIDAKPTFAVVTTDGFQVPVEQLVSLYEVVKTEVFPLLDPFVP